jgi:hypothetical protein
MAHLSAYRCSKCGASFRCDTSDECFVCGNKDCLEPAAPSEPVTVLASPRPRSTGMGRAGGGDAAQLLAGGFRLYKAGKWFLGSAFILVLSGLLVFAPDLRDDPRRIGGSDIARGLATGIVGLVMLGLGMVYLIRPTRPQPKITETPNTPKQTGEALGR